MYPDSREIDSILLQESNTRKSRNTNCPTIHPVKFFLPYNESLSRARSLNAREEKKLTTRAYSLSFLSLSLSISFIVHNAVLQLNVDLADR